MIKTTWTTEQDDFVRANRGVLSASQIGAHLGKTRNAVLGRADRLGLERLPTSAPSIARGQGRLRPKGGRRDKYLKLPPELRPVPWTPPERDDAPPPLNIPFVDLGPRHCREVVGHDGLALYCGHPTPDGSSWCVWHRAVNFTRARPTERAYVPQHLFAARAA